uniref:Endonuclease/exonuclease/phosphatase domain-containing protein n=1 Tax=Cannabis sativa TaxID=3483 RepID=A0A803QIA9_CANSA
MVAAYNNNHGGKKFNDQFARIEKEVEERLLLDDDGKGELTEIDDHWCLVGHFLTRHSIDFNVTEHKMTSLWQPNGGICAVEAQGLSGGLAFLWTDMDDSSLLGFSHHHIDMQIKMAEGISWRLKGLYEEPTRLLQPQTWQLLRTLVGDSPLPWCVIGDINNVLCQEDKKGGQPHPRWLIDDFQRCLTDCGLEDMDLLGYPFTWERICGTSRWVEIYLDRALTSSDQT